MHFLANHQEITRKEVQALLDVGQSTARRVVKEIDVRIARGYLGWLATLLGCQGIDEYRAMLPATLRCGITPVQAKEIVYQAVAYLGIGRVFPFLKATNEILETQGVELPLAEQATTDPARESRMAGGEQT